MTTVSSARLTVPGPRPLPILGATGQVLRAASDTIGYARRLFAASGPLVALSAGGGTNLFSPLPACPGTVLVYGPDLVREVATQHEIFYKYPISGGMYPLEAVSPRTAPLRYFLTGLFGVNSDEHRQQRRLLMPAFHKQRVDAYRDDMVAIAQSHFDRWQPGDQRDILDEMLLLSMRIATRTLFGDESGERGVLREALRLLANPFTRLLRYDWPGLPYHRFLSLAARYETEMRTTIERKRAAGAGTGDMLALLMQARDADSGARLTDEELLGHVGAIFAAAHETGASALTWTLFLLAQHPQIAADVLDELDRVLHGDAPSVEQLAQLPLLEWVVKESLRVLPPAPWNGRVTSQPTALGGYMLPAGTEVLVSIYQTHHMPELYAEPEQFNPRRWETIAPTIFEYNPFSAGPRMCIGATFAMMEIRIVLAMLLQRFRLQCLPQRTVDRSGAIVLSPKGGMPMIIHRQDRRFSQSVGRVRGNVREMVWLHQG